MSSQLDTLSVAAGQMPDFPVAVPEILFAFLSFYVALATVFIPLTFSLIATLKQQYKEALQDRAVRAKHGDVHAFQDLFFQYNDAFSELIVFTSIQGAMALTMGSVVLSRLPSPYWSIASVALFMLVLSCGIRYMKKSHGALLAGVFLRPSMAFRTELESCLGTDGAPANRAAPRLRQIYSLLWWNVLLVFLVPLALVLAYWTPAVHETVTIIGFPLLTATSAVHVGLIIYFWWDLYVRWRPFTYLREIESLPVSRRYQDELCQSLEAAYKRAVAPRRRGSEPSLNDAAKGECSDLYRLAESLKAAKAPGAPRQERHKWHSWRRGAAQVSRREESVAKLSGLCAMAHEQQKTYAEFMSQYEADDEHRLDGVQFGQLMESVGNAGALADWVNAVRDTLGILPDGESPVIPIVYIGCGYCSLVQSIVEKTKKALGEDFSDAKFVVMLVDSYSLGCSLSADSKNYLDSNLNPLKNAGHDVRPVVGDAHSVLRVLCGEPTKLQIPGFDSSASPDSSKIYLSYPRRHTEVEVLEAFSWFRTLSAPPLVVLANNTYGAIIDPHCRPGAVADQEGEKRSQTIEHLVEESSKGLLALLVRAFEPMGFGYLIHNKHAPFAEQEDRFPYRSHNWIRLRGTDPTAGLYLLARWGEGERPYYMVSRWMTTRRFVSEFKSAVDQHNKREMRTVDYAIKVQGFEVPVDGRSSGCAGSRAAQPHIWCAGFIGPVSHGGKKTWYGENVSQSWNVEKEVKVFDRMQKEANWSLLSTFVQQPKLSWHVYDVGAFDGTMAVKILESLKIENVESYLAMDVNKRVEGAPKAVVKVRRMCTGSYKLLDGPLEDSAFDGDKPFARIVILWNVIHHMLPKERSALLRALDKALLTSTAENPCVVIVSTWDDEELVSRMGTAKAEYQEPMETFVAKCLRGEETPPTSFACGQLIRELAGSPGASGATLGNLRFESELSIVRKITRAEMGHYYNEDPLSRKIAVLVHAPAKNETTQQ